MLLLASTSLAVAQASTTEVDAQEPPAIVALLRDGTELEQSVDTLDGHWQAARRYCEAARLGSIEAQYRLGMLYAFGRGVPESREWAASLFSLASSQGHAQAHAMLDTISISSTELPACVLDAVAPARKERPAPTAVANTSLDRLIDDLPRNRRWIVDLVNTQSRWNAVDPRLILSIIAAESNFETKATSPKSAMGLMQLIPDTAERFNVTNAFNASQNIRAGLAYVRWLLSYYQGDVKLALAAYNAGEGVVDRYKGIPPYKETRQYVQRIMTLYGQPAHPFDNRAGKVSPMLGAVNTGDAGMVRKPSPRPVVKRQ